MNDLKFSVEKINSCINLRKSMVVNYDALNDKINEIWAKTDLPIEVLVGFSIKCCVSSMNVDIATDIIVDGKSYNIKEHFLDHFKLERGVDSKEDSLTLSRICNVMAPSVAKYLMKRPEDVRLKINNVRPSLSFPQSVHIPKLSDDAIVEALVWNLHFDKVMSRNLKLMNKPWRSIFSKNLNFICIRYNKDKSEIMKRVMTMSASSKVIQSYHGIDKKRMVLSPRK
jgi:hypothetical protein